MKSNRQWTILFRVKEGFDLAAVRFPVVNSSGCVKVLKRPWSGNIYCRIV
jgi:hypothetical protein